MVYSVVPEGIATRNISPAMVPEGIAARNISPAVVPEGLAARKMSSVVVPEGNSLRNTANSLQAKCSYKLWKFRRMRYFFFVINTLSILFPSMSTTSIILSETKTLSPSSGILLIWLNT